MHTKMSLVPEFEQLYQSFTRSQADINLLAVDGIAPHQLDIGANSYQFFNEKLADVSSDASVNFVEDVSPTNYKAFVDNGIMKLLGYNMLWYYSNKRYGKEFADKALSMIWRGDLYFHDAHGAKLQMPYCFAFSLDKIVMDGRPYGTSPNTPPKHRKSFISQVDKLIADMSKQFAGAVAPSDFFLWYAWYCKIDNLDLDNQDHIHEILQDLQGFVCLLNEPSRAEGDPPFTNIALYDKFGLESLFSHIVYPDMTIPDLDYIMKLQKIFAEWFSHGDPITGFPYKFPVVTINCTTLGPKQGFADVEFAQWVAKTNIRMANFNIHFGTKSKLAMCCRYENDLEDMDMTPDSFGNGGVNIGSHRVVTPAFARAAINAMDYAISLSYNGSDIKELATSKFYEILDDYFDVASKLLVVHRYDILESRIRKNPDYLKFFGRLNWFNLKTMFSTFGVSSIHEAVQFMGHDILSEDGTDFALDLMSYIRSKVRQYRKEYGISFNAEEIPGEQACVSMVRKDRIICGGGVENRGKTKIKTELYSNQYIPLTADVDILTRIDLSGRFMSMISGGGIVHLNMSILDTWEKMYEIMNLCAMSGVPHVAICFRFGKCEDGHVSIIDSDYTCRVCGKQVIQSRSRIIGYFSDEQHWNRVRREYDRPNRYFSEGDELVNEQE